MAVYSKRYEAVSKAITFRGPLYMLTWTHDKPKEPGWYQYRYPEGRVLVLHVARVSEGAFFEGQTKMAWPWDYYPGAWLGPIDPPTPTNPPSRPA